MPAANVTQPTHHKVYFILVPRVARTINGARRVAIVSTKRMAAIVGFFVNPQVADAFELVNGEPPRACAVAVVLHYGFKVRWKFSDHC